MRLRLIKNESKKQLTSLQIQFHKICLAVADYGRRHKDIAVLRRVVAGISSAEVDQEELLLQERVTLNMTIELVQGVICRNHPGIDFSSLTFESVVGFDDKKDDKIDVKLSRKDVRSMWGKTRKPRVKKILDVVNKNTDQVSFSSSIMYVCYMYCNC